MKKNKIFLAVAIGSIAIANGSNVQAEEPKRAAALEEVIVTSRRVEETVQEVPLAITAMTSEQLQEKGVATLIDLAQNVPSVQQSNSVGRKAATQFAIRGQRQSEFSLNADPSIGIYISGVPQYVQGAGMLGALDVQAMEVLKGPQGTLFGRNTTGGAINITPNEPTQSTNGYVKGSLGNYELRTIEAGINVPLTDTLAARIAIADNQQNGTIKNLDFPGHDFYNRDDQEGRVSLKWVPSDSFDTLLVVDGFRVNDHGAPAQIIAANPALPLGAFFYQAAYISAQVDYKKDFWSAHAGEKPYSKVDIWGVMNTSTYNASDDFSVKNIAAYRSLDVDDFTDLDGVVIPLQFNTNVLTKAEQYTEELQLIYSGDAVDWTAGLFYMRVKGSDISESNQFGPINQAGASGIDNETVAVYGQSTFHLTDDLNLTLGLRETRDTKNMVWTDRQLSPTSDCLLSTPQGSLGGATPCRLSANASWAEPTWNVTLDWQVSSDQLIYIAHRHGYRAGAFNGRVTRLEDIKAADPEIVDDLEVGYKGDLELAGAPLRVNGAIYYQDYKDIQRTSIYVPDPINAPNTTATVLVNAAKAKMYGGEIEITYLPIDSVEISGYYSYINASYDSFPAQCSACGPGGTVASIDRSANSFAMVPENSGKLSIRYMLPFSSDIGAIWVGVNAYFQSKIALYDDNRVDAEGVSIPNIFQDGYTLYGARVDWDNVLGSANWKVSLWGKNLGNEKYYTGASPFYSNIGYVAGYPGEPRTYGMDISYKFDE